jgi:hypothetical protein
MTFKVTMNPDGSAHIDFRGLKPEETRELVDLLRMTFMHQKVRPVFNSRKDEQPAHVICKMIPKHYWRMLELLHLAGGWIAPAIAPGTKPITCPHGLADWRVCRTCLGEITAQELEGKGQVVINPEEGNGDGH